MALFFFTAIMISQGKNSSWSARGPQRANHEYDTIHYKKKKHTIIEIRNCKSVSDNHNSRRTLLISHVKIERANVPPAACMTPLH